VDQPGGWLRHARIMAFWRGDSVAAVETGGESVRMASLEHWAAVALLGLAT
jgi:hypothetical protein